MKRHGGAERFTDWRIAQRLSPAIRPISIPITAAEKTRAVEAMLLDSVRPLPLIEVVKSYHGRRPMAVGTGSEHRMAEMLLRHLGLFNCFDAIVGADDVQRHKPEPDTFLRCAELIGVPPENAWCLKTPILAFKRRKVPVWLW